MTRRAWLVALVAALAAGAGCRDGRSVQPPPPVAVAAPPARPATDQLRVMSYNVNFGIAGDPSTIEAIAAVNADIVLLQETNAEWESAIVGRLGERYPHRRFDPPTDWVAGGLGILSRA